MRRNQIRGVTALGLGVCLLLAGCGSDASSRPETTLDDVFALTFTSSRVIEDSVERPLASEQPITLTFTEEGISVLAGCNTLLGGASIESGQLVLTSTLASTKMACDEPLMLQDEWLSGFLSSSPTIVKDGDALTLASEGTAIEFTVLDTAGLYDTPVFGPEELPRAQALCDKLLSDGATVDEARAAAEDRGYIFRIASQDGESFPEPNEVNAGRIRVEVVNSIVVGCIAG